MPSAGLNKLAEDAKETPDMKAVKAYAAARGWPNITSEAYTLVSRPGELLTEVMSTLGAGDSLVINHVGALSERPSEQERIVRQCLGAGIHLHCLSPEGPITQYLTGMFAVWAAAAPMEQELERALSDMAAMEQRHETDLRDFEEDLTQRILAEGVSITVGKGNGHDADHSLGEAIKHARTKRNLSQRQLGELCGISHTQIGRLEAHGYGEGLSQVLATLEPQQ
jgi:hypothetical protein